MSQAKPTSDQLYLDMGRKMPGWVTRGLSRVVVPEASPIAGEGLGVMAGEFLAMEPVSEGQETTPKDPVYGALCGAFADHYTWLADLMEECSIETATGEWLDLHAEGRGFARFTGEDDGSLRARIRTAPAAATHAAIRTAVNAIGRGGSVIRAIDYAERTLDLGEGPVEIEAGAVIADGDDWPIRFEDLTAGDHVTIDDQLPDGRPIQWVRRLVYVFTLRDRQLAFDQDYWDQGFWGWGVLPVDEGGALPSPNGRNVAIVVVPPQTVSEPTYWDQFYWDQAFWGGTWEDENRYQAIYDAARRTAAAGVITLLWTQEDS
jgi:hypothetical protein